MRIKQAGISIFINNDHTTIELTDKKNWTHILKITLTPEQLSSALSRLGDVDCEVEIYNVDRINKKKVSKKIYFKMPEDKPWDKEEASRLATLICEKKFKGWEPDTYFGSQSSFFYKNNQSYARTTIYKYVEDKSFRKV